MNTGYRGQITKRYLTELATAQLANSRTKSNLC